MRLRRPHRTLRSLRTDRRGVVLTVAIIIVTTLLATGFLVSDRILRTFTETRNLYLTLPAFYAAESGAERGLAVVKRARAVPGTELCTTDPAGCANPDDALRVIEDLAVLPADAGSLTGVGTSYAIDADATTSLEGPYRTALKENESLTFAFFAPESPAGYEGGGEFPQVTQLELRKDGGATQNPGTWLEVRWVGFEHVGAPATGYAFGENGRVQLVSPSQLASGSPTVALTRPTGSGCNILAATCPSNLVQIRALYGSLEGLTVTPKNAAGTTVGVPNRVTVASQGVVQRGAEQATAVVTVSTAWRVPASGFFTYTVFSESDLTK